MFFFVRGVQQMEEPNSGFQWGRFHDYGSGKALGDTGKRSWFGPCSFDWWIPWQRGQEAKWVTESESCTTSSGVRCAQTRCNYGVSRFQVHLRVPLPRNRPPIPQFNTCSDDSSALSPCPRHAPRASLPRVKVKFCQPFCGLEFSGLSGGVHLVNETLNF